MLVIGSRGNTGMKKLASGGSFSEYLLKNCNIPIIICKRDICISSIRTLCFPVDQSEESITALKWAKDNFLLPGDEVSFINVKKDGNISPETKENVAKFVKEHLGNAKLKGNVIPGTDPKLEITNYLKEARPDICIIGTRNLKGIQKVFAGSVTDYILSNVNDVPVLVLK